MSDEFNFDEATEFLDQGTKGCLTVDGKDGKTLIFSVRHFLGGALKEIQKLREQNRKFRELNRRLCDVAFKKPIPKREFEHIYEETDPQASFRFFVGPDDGELYLIRAHPEETPKKARLHAFVDGQIEWQEF